MKATMFKTLLPFLGIWASLASLPAFAVAEKGSQPLSDLSGYSSPHKLDLEKLKALWKAKCSASVIGNSSCYLSEKDVDPRGSTEKVLLFRGEPEIFAQPATSSYFRQRAKSAGLCENGCTLGAFDAQLQADLQGLLIERARPVMRANSYLRKPGVWISEAGSSAVLASYPFGEVVRQHLVGRGLYFESSRSSFDPFVSFSGDPGVAENFASQKVIYVASVPRDMVQDLGEYECNEGIYKPDHLYTLQNCSTDFTVNLEVEVSALFYLPQKYLYSIIKLKD